MIKQVVVGALLVFVLTSCVLSQETPETLRTALKTEGVQGWRQWEEWFQGTKCLLRERRLDHADNKQDDKAIITEWEFQQKDRNFLFRAVGGDSTTVCANNDDYSFHLYKHSPDKPWIIGYCGRPRSGRIQEEFETTIATLRSPWEAWNIPMWQIVQDKGFAIESLEEVQIDGETKVHLTFTLNSKDPDDHLRELKKGDVVFDPGLSWAICSAHLFLSRGRDRAFQVVMQMQYDGSANPPHLVGHTYTLKRQSGQKITWSTKIHDYTSCSLGPEDFTLSAFGLPEPGTKPRTPLRYGLMAVGVLMIAIALSLRKKKNTREAV